MKTLACDICTREFSAEIFEDWFQQMKGHYMADHADFMAAMADRPKSDGEKWLSDAEARFDAA